jgi:starch phosphorylase
MNNTHGTIAYFSMEIGLEAEMPTYSGGLGVLAGDTIRSAADLKIPLVAVTLLHRKGYFYQRLGADGWQREEPAEWVVDDFLTEMPHRVTVTLEGRTVQIRCWQYAVSGVSGFTVPVYFLDTDLADNTDWDRTLTHYLYGGDQRYRLCQEVILGIGGVRMLRALGYKTITRFHMNEGHASLLTLELLDEEVRKAGRQVITHDDIAAVREQCVFTTHTPVAAGHDQFPLELVDRVLGRREVFDMKEVFCCEGLLNMTYLALNLSHYVNGVAKRHGEVSSHLFAGYVIDFITNGVHAATWTAEPFQELYDRYIPGWKQDNFSLRYALSMPKPEVWQAHMQAKKRLLHAVNRETNVGMEVDVCTLGFARRATTYKRADLLFTDIDRLRSITAKTGALQVVYAGKAHPQDQGGKDLIKRIFQAKEALKRDLKVVYLQNYDMALGKLMTAGVDVWLNTPQPPLEASGTSGMKAALNGVPSLSVLDGWWIEGRIEGITGWAIGDDGRDGGDKPKVVSSLYDKLEQVVLPLFYRDRERFLEVMLHAIALNGSFFNTHRMMQQYVLEAYF